jgi:hypothetical protein
MSGTGIDPAITGELPEERARCLASLEPGIGRTFEAERVALRRLGASGVVPRSTGFLRPALRPRVGSLTAACARCDGA